MGSTLEFPWRHDGYELIRVVIARLPLAVPQHSEPLADAGNPAERGNRADRGAGDLHEGQPLASGCASAQLAV